MSSETKTRKTSWKKLLLQAKKLNTKIGMWIYRRTKILLEIFDDAEFRAEIGLRDDLQAAEWLDKEFKGVALKFLQLRAILNEYPDEKQWMDGDLQTMFNSIKPNKPEIEKPPRTRQSVTLAEYKMVCEQRDHLQYQVNQLELELTTVAAERDRLKKRVVSQATSIRELKATLKGELVPV